MMPQSMLIVEDDVTLSESIACVARYYAPPEMRIFRVTTVADAIRELEDRSYEILWLDVLLPDGTGWQVLEDCLHLGWMPKSVAICSGIVDVGRKHDELVALLATLTKLHVLTKPVTLEQIEHVVRGE